MGETLPGHARENRPPAFTPHRRHHSYHDAMGFNPFRVRRRSAADIVLVVVTLAVAAALVVWAAFSG